MRNYALNTQCPEELKYFFILDSKTSVNNNNNQSTFLFLFYYFKLKFLSLKLAKQLKDILNSLLTLHLHVHCLNLSQSFHNSINYLFTYSNLVNSWYLVFYYFCVSFEQFIIIKLGSKISIIILENLNRNRCILLLLNCILFPALLIKNIIKPDMLNILIIPLNISQ